MDVLTGFFLGIFAPFLVMGWSFFIIFVVFLLAEVVCMKYDNWGAATGVLIAALVAIYILVDPPNGQTWLSFASIGILSIWAALYPVGGVIWSWLYGIEVKASRTKKEVKRRKEAIMASEKDEQRRQEALERVEQWKEKQHPKYRKSEFLGYFIFWPFSLIAVFLGDFVFEAFSIIGRALKSIALGIWNLIAGTLGRIWDSRMND